MTSMNKSKGIFYIIFASSIFGLMPLFALIGMENGLNTYTIIMFRCFFATIWLYTYMKLSKIDYKIEKKIKFQLILLSFFGYGLMLVTLFNSYNYIPSGISTTIHFVYPAVVLIGSVIFYNDKITYNKVIVLITAIIGIYLLSDNNEGVIISNKGLILALASGFFYAYYILKVSNSKLKNINSYVLIYYISLYNSIYFFVLSIATGNLNFEITSIGYIDMLILSIFSVIAMVAFKNGLNYISSYSAAIISTFEPLTSIIVGAFIFKETFNLRSLLGITIIIMSVIYIALIEKKWVINISETKVS